MTRPDFPMLWKRVQHESRVYTAGGKCSRFCRRNSLCARRLAVIANERKDTYNRGWRWWRSSSWTTTAHGALCGLQFCIDVLAVVIIVLFVPAQLHSTPTAHSPPRFIFVHIVQR